MPLISLRLPEDLDARLEREARTSGRAKSELARDAIALYLDKRRQAAFVRDYVRSALGEDGAATRQLAAEFLPLENEALVREESSGAATPGRVSERAAGYGRKRKRVRR